MRRTALSSIALAVLALAPAAAARTPRVLRVGSWHGIAGQYRSIQAAVNAAKPGDWVLVGPGDYKTTSSRAPAGRANTPAAVLIQTPRLSLRGMNRNTVVIDGTKPGSPQCSRAAGDQNFGPSATGGALGLNGVMVWKADNVTVQNLTACNFLGGSGDTGNEIWWNGGDGSGQIGGWGYTGSYLNTTSTYFGGENTAARYGIFSSNWDGGTWDQTYASNFNDSGYYIGACQQQCNQTMDHAWAEGNALGYSGSNSGGWMLIENSKFDNNEDGFDTNSQNGDNPPPQDGSCPAGVKPPVAGAPSCWVFTHNLLENNNNPNVPAAGTAAAGPVGTGMSLSGARNDTVMDNTFIDNMAWGTILVPYLDSGPPCTGGTQDSLGCLFDEWGDALIGNTYTNNGGYGHPTNGDIAWVNFESGHPTDCFSGNTDTTRPLVTSPSNLQQNYPTCDGHAIPANNNNQFLLEVLCDSQVEIVSGQPPQCPSGQYPRRQGTPPMPALPPASQLPSMSHACSGVPADPWCKGQVIKVKTCAARTVWITPVLDPREKLRAITVQTAHHAVAAAGNVKRIEIGLSARRHRRARVSVSELIRVGHHHEKITYTLLYHRC